MAVSLPDPNKVQSYLAAHQLESVLEGAVNEAVINLVKDPFEYIANQLMQHSKTLAASKGGAAGGSRASNRRVSLGGVPLPAGGGTDRRVSLSEATFQQATEQKRRASVKAIVDGPVPKDSLTKPKRASKSIKTPDGEEEEEEDEDEEEEEKAKYSGEELQREYVKSDVKMSEELEKLLKSFFTKLDQDGDGTVTKDEATAFWGKNFAKVNATSMFNEVDENGDEAISWDEFLAFWQNVVGSGYDEDDLLEEVQMMLEGGSWVDFDDGRTT